ncbi:MAG TPA: GNAT family N-acetyltransferase, partial [Deltaproteobacteria bacterium]|nr:GNAT family N-acetyltransferase [Deltaproteobacteria bacterium]
TTHKGWQDRGIGTFLLQYLVRIAREKNISGFTADVLARNTPMMKVFSKVGYPLKAHLEYGVYEIAIPLPTRRRRNPNNPGNPFEYSYSAPLGTFGWNSLWFIILLSR